MAGIVDLRHVCEDLHTARCTKKTTRKLTPFLDINNYFLKGQPE